MATFYATELSPHYSSTLILDNVPVVRERTCVRALAQSTMFLTPTHLCSGYEHACVPAAITYFTVHLEMTPLVFFQSRSEAGSELREKEEAEAALSGCR